MKAKLLPVYYETAEHPDFVRQLNALKKLLADEVEFLEPAALGAPLPDADGVVFPQMLGAAYRMADAIKDIQLPRLVITSEFGTMSMWDWEIDRYLRAKNIEMFTPYNLEQTKIICKALSLKRELSKTRFLVYQDHPGQKGFQDDIFRRFYWWEEECTARMKDHFGVELVKRSFKTLGETAHKIPDAEAKAVWRAWEARVPVDALTPKSILSAVKLYMAVLRDLEQDPAHRSLRSRSGIGGCTHLL